MSPERSKPTQQNLPQTFFLPFFHTYLVTQKTSLQPTFLYKYKHTHTLQTEITPPLPKSSSDIN